MTAADQPQPAQHGGGSDHVFRAGRDAAHCGFLYWQASGKHIECDQPESDHVAPGQESGGGEEKWNYRECKRQLDSVRLQLAAVEDRLRISEVLKGQLQEDKAALTQRAEADETYSDLYLDRDRWQKRAEAQRQHIEQQNELLRRRQTEITGLHRRAEDAERERDHVWEIVKKWGDDVAASGYDGDYAALQGFAEDQQRYIERLRVVVEAARLSVEADHVYTAHADQCQNETACEWCGVLSSIAYDRHVALVAALDSTATAPQREQS